MILSLINQKGGVGKTTNTIHLGACLAQMGKSVLLVDFDSQMDLTHGSGIRHPQYTIIDLLTEPSKKFRVRTRAENLSILAGSSDLTAGRFERDSLKKALEPLKSHFDYILLDCPPEGINAYSLSLPEIALNACDNFLIPLFPNEYAVKNSNSFLGRVMEVVQPKNKGLVFSGFFFGKVLVTSNKHRIYSQMMEKVAPNLMFKNFVRQDSQVDHAVSEGMTIFQYSPNCRAANDYRKLTKEFIKRTK
ncbi:MAG: ParA family protein [Maribacter sp.]